jgi:phosphatidylglycerophosphatase A
MKNNCFMAWYATLGPIGYLPASGTCATIVTIMFLVCLPHTYGYGYLALMALLSYFAYFSINKILKITSTKDPSEIVIDEVLGTLTTFYGISLNPVMIGLGFILFRFFDISKIWPIYIFEKLPGASGILLDDVIAGLFSNVLLRVLLWYLNY